MAKPRSITTEELIRLCEEYRLENLDRTVTIPEFGAYIRGKGYDVQDYTIRRDTEFRTYLDNLKKEQDARAEQDIVVYKTLDVDSFIDKHPTKARLKEALVARDQYYADIASKAAVAIKKRKELEHKVSDLEETVKALESRLATKEEKDFNGALKKKDRIIIGLKNLLDSYVYPDAANAILKKDGILDVLNSVVPDELMEERTLKADSEIKEARYSSVADLMKGFEDEQES